MRIKQLSLAVMSTVLISGLQGCANEDFAAQSCAPNESQSDVFACDYISQTAVVVAPTTGFDKGGLTGTVFGSEPLVGAKVCFDYNQNAQCDGNEPFELSFAAGKYSFAPDAPRNGARLVAQVISSSGQSQLTLLSEHQHINAFTTLHASDVQLNPLVQGNSTQALDALLAEPLAWQTQWFSSNDEAENVNSEFTRANRILAANLAFAQQASGLTWQAIASVVDATVQQRRFDAQVDIEGIPLQKALTDQLTLAAFGEPIALDKQHADEAVTSVVGNETWLAVASKWHNRLQLLSKTEQGLVRAGDTPFAYVAGARDTVDATTGASEQVLSQLVLNQDSLFGLLSKYQSNSAAKGLGVYHALLNDVNLGNLTDTQFAQVASGSAFKPAAEANLLVAQPEGLWQVLIDGKNELHWLVQGNLAEPSIRQTVQGEVKAISANKQGVWLATYRPSSLQFWPYLATEPSMEFAINSFYAANVAATDTGVYYSIRNAKELNYLDGSQTTSQPTSHSVLSFNEAITQLWAAGDRIAAATPSSIWLYDQTSQLEQTVSLSQRIKHGSFMGQDHLVLLQTSPSNVDQLQPYQLNIDVAGEYSAQAKAQWYQLHRSPEVRP